MNIIEIIKKAGRENEDSLRFRRECWRGQFNSGYGEKGIYFDYAGTFWWRDGSICKFRAMDFLYDDWEIVEEGT